MILSYNYYIRRGCEDRCRLVLQEFGRAPSSIKWRPCIRKIGLFDQVCLTWIPARDYEEIYISLQFVSFVPLNSCVDTLLF